jgi:hypothetical protein
VGIRNNVSVLQQAEMSSLLTDLIYEESIAKNVHT